MSDGVEFRVRDGSARIKLDRPAQGNALGLAEALGAADPAAANDPSVRCVVLIGTGRFFGTGGDVASFAAADRRGAFVKDLADQLDAEAAGIGHAADGDEGRAGVDTFLAKRSPHFKSAAVA